MIYVTHLIIVIRSNIWAIGYCLGYGYVAMVCAICFSALLSSIIYHSAFTGNNTFIRTIKCRTWLHSTNVNISILPCPGVNITFAYSHQVRFCLCYAVLSGNEIMHRMETGAAEILKSVPLLVESSVANGGRMVTCFHRTPIAYDWLEIKARIRNMYKKNDFTHSLLTAVTLFQEC